MTIPRIDSYNFGRIVIDGKSHGKDVVILPDRVISNWWRDEGHNLTPQDLGEVMAARPQVLVVGKGAFSRMDVDDQTVKALKEAGIELIALPTGHACQAYNRLREEKAVAAALHLTC